MDKQHGCPRKDELTNESIMQQFHIFIFDILYNWIESLLSDICIGWNIVWKETHFSMFSRNTIAHVLQNDKWFSVKQYLVPGSAFYLTFTWNDRRVKQFTRCNINAFALNSTYCFFLIFWSTDLRYICHYYSYQMFF